MEVANPQRISKLLSLMLRHRPDEFGLAMDACGFVPLDEVVRAVKERFPEVEEADIRDLAVASPQRRFEIAEPGIRALYGHSFFIEMDGPPMEPPDRLYMGCERRATRNLRTDGIKPVDRFYVHLSQSRQVAEERSAHLDAACVVEVLARQAQAEGIEFYSRGEVVLTRHIPPQFVGEIWDLGPPVAEVPAGRAEPPASGARRAEPRGAEIPQAAKSFGRRPRKATGRR